jgi:hypothetical protein
MINDSLQEEINMLEKKLETVETRIVQHARGAP